jgi:vancomycin resistance protein VanW
MLQHLLPIRLRVSIHNILRHMSNIFDRRTFMSKNDKTGIQKKVIISERQSVLIKQVPEEYMELQRNKIKTLQIASDIIDGLVIQPGEYFSFWRLVGKPTRRKGYTLGFELQGGRLIKSVAGGLCQLTNALCFCAINSGMKIVERHRHGLDLFKDHNRDVPFGSGATVLYNFKDLIFQNTHDYPLKIQTKVTDKHLIVGFYAEKEPETRFKMEERKHCIYESGSKKMRSNEIWQIGYRQDDIISENLVFKNNAELQYEWEDKE